MGEETLINGEKIPITNVWNIW